MPLSYGLASRTAFKGEGHIHTDKWHRCVEHVKGQGGDVDPYAVCTASLGYEGSVNPEHQRQGKSRKKKSDVAYVQMLRAK